ncbi:UBP1-associated protein 2C [Gastrolobium bilobum]|uniref:UBP1-associated protein 2C n=1 Tax=Gastrolobium bilobum TaxID=150636 RepID=UPI002AB27301|nr:UBP1-associated protein 2C [Gastrolobium bilobum]
MAMDPTKKRKLDENGFGDADSEHLNLSPSEARKMMERFTHDQLLDILQDAAVRHPDVLNSVRIVADPDVSQRKLFIRGLGWDTTTDGLRSLFSAFGLLEEAVVILDKATGKSKGYGFVTFRHVDGALLALREPSKRIDGRVTVTQLAAAGNSGSNTNAADIALRKIYVANVPPDLPADKLLAHFSVYGEIEEGPLGFDKQTGKSKGFALFVYKTPEGAQAALLEPVKNVEGRQLNCKLAITDGKQGKRGGPGPVGPDGVQGHGNAHHGHGDGMGLAPSAGSGPGSLSGQYGGPVGLGSYGGFPGGLQGQPPMGNHPLNSSVGGLSSMGNQAPSAMGSAGGYGAGLGGHYGGYGGPGSTGFGGLGGGGGGGLGGGSGGVGAGVGGGAGGLGGSGGALGGAGSLYRLPSSAGMPAPSGYQESGHYSLSGSSGYQNQHHPPTGASPVPRVPPGSMYPNVPPYY